MAPIEEGRAEVMGRVFNALWRERFARSRRCTTVFGTDGGSYAVVELPNGVEVMGRLQGKHSLERLTTTFPYYARFRPSGRIETLKTAEELAALLPARNSSVDRLCDEVDQSSRNMGLFLERRAGRLRELPGKRGQGALSRAFAKTRVRGCRPEEYLESWTLRGHALHPGTKTRGGFSRADLERYSPELGCQVGLRFAALRRSHAVESLSSAFSADFPKAWSEEFRESASRRGVDLSEHHVMAVHPWQWENVIPAMFTRELAEGVLVPLDPVFEAQPLASLRTVAPLGDLDACQVKLPLAIQATSVPRTITAPTVENSPRISDLLQAVLRKEQDLAELVSLSPETRGVHFWEKGAPDAAEKARHLTMLLRGRPERRTGQQLVPNVILAESSPFDGRPFAAELVERADGDPLTYFYDYVLLSARVTLGFLARYGLGIEAHAQNTLTYHRRGAPVGWVLRDFGGLRIDRARLRETGLDVELHPETLIVTKDDAELVSSFHHSWLQGNVAPLAAALSREFHTPEAALWHAARAAVRAAWDGERGRVGSRRAEALEKLLFRSRVGVKALTRMRLADDPWTEEFCEVDNPLAALCA